MLLPPVTFEQIELTEANACLIAWGHKMGPLERGDADHMPHFVGSTDYCVEAES